MKRILVMVAAVVALGSTGIAPAAAESVLDVVAPTSGVVGQPSQVQVTIATDEPLVGRTELSVLNPSTGAWDVVFSEVSPDLVIMLTTPNLTAGENLFRVTYRNFSEVTHDFTITGASADPDPDPDPVPDLKVVRAILFAPRVVLAGQKFPVLVVWTGKDAKRLSGKVALQTRTGDEEWSVAKVVTVRNGTGFALLSQRGTHWYRVVSPETGSVKAAVSKEVRITAVTPRR